MNKIAGILIIVLCFQHVYIAAQFTSPRFQRITPAEGLPNGEVPQIREDEEGFIWFSTAEGICRYDGYKIDILRGGDNVTTQALNKHRPVFFTRDKQKRWWICSDFAGVRCFDPTQNRLNYLLTKDYTDEYPADIIMDTLSNTYMSSILWDGSHRIWLGSINGIDVFDLTKMKLDKNPRLIQPVSDRHDVRHLVQDTKGNIWALIAQKGLFCFDTISESWSQVITDSDIRAFSFDKEGSIFWITSKKLYHYNIKTKIQTQPYGEIIKIMEAKTDFSSVCCDKLGRLWIGSSNGLLLLRGHNIPPQIFQHDPHNSYSLLSDWIRTIYEDSKSNIWVACGSDGVCLIPNSFERIQVFENMAKSHRIDDLDIGSDSTVYALTTTHLIISRFPYYQSKVISLSNLIPCPNATIKKITTGTDGKIYCLSACGIWAFSPLSQKCSLVTAIGFEKKTPAGINFLSFNIWGDSVLTYNWMEKPGIYAFNLKNGTLTIHNNPSLKQNAIFTQGMLQDKNGSFWSNGYRGLTKLGHLLYKSDTFSLAHVAFNWKNYQHTNNAGKPLLLIGDDLWWGRYDGGGLNVLSFKDTAYAYFLKENGLYDNSVISLVQDKAGHLWAGTNLGICRIQLPPDFRKATHLTAQNFSTADGLPHNTVLCSITTWDKKQIFAGTVGGLVLINTEGGATDTIPPKVVFTNLSIMNKTVRAGDSTSILTTDIDDASSITLHYNQAFFTLEVSGLNFVNPRQTRYAYRLAGSKSDWIDNGFSNTISFNNIASGNYVLEVKAQASNGLWSPAKSLTIQVLPPIWKRWWFISLCLLSVAGAIYTFYRWRLEQIRKVQTLQNNIAADLHDDVGAALTNIEILSFLSKNQLSDTEKAQNLIEKIGEEAKKTNESLHQLVWTMKSENDGMDKTLAQLNRLAVDNLEVQGIRFSVTMPQNTEGGYRKLTGEKRRDLILVFKEVLANITKHACADAVWMRVDIGKHILKIDIEDNGVGMQPKEGNGIGGNGLKNMQNRMARYDGSVSIEKSQNYGGVWVKIRLPF